MSGSGTRAHIASGNAAVAPSRPGFHEVYDRGELLWLIARSIIEQDACPEEARVAFGLTDQEVADILSMSD
jgi:hypothetical protein